MAAVANRRNTPARSVVPSGKIPLAWQGGLNLALDAGFIRDDELSGGSNFLVRDGKARLDQRYILKLEQQVGSRTPRGSGWGKYSTGSQSEQYCAVLDDAMYLVDLTTILTFTAVAGATSLATSDWWFQQFQDFIYAGNITNGLGRKKLAAGSNGTGDWSLIQLPTAPAAAPGVTFDPARSDPATFLGSSISGSGFSSSYDATGDRWLITPSAAGVTFEVTITFDTSPDERPNWQYHDISELRMSGSVGLPEMFVNDSGGASIAAILWQKNIVGSTFADFRYRLQNIARTNRDLITALKFRITSQDTNQIAIHAPTGYGVWLSLDSSTNPGTADPTFKELRYEHTYFNSTTALESPPSPAKIISASGQSPLGDWYTLSAPTTAQSGVDKVRFYRVVTEGGTTTRYRIAEVNNTGHPTTVTTTDKYPLDEIKTNAIYIPSVLPGSGITGLTAWQNRLVLAVGSLVYISRDGLPLVYEQQSGAFDVNNPGRGITFYPDDRRAEEIIAVVGQDDLYMVSKYSVRCLVGNSPGNWRLIKLPDAEGACGPRAVAAYKKGILVLTPSGKLMYHHSGLPEPQEVSTRVRKRSGADNIAALATADASVTVWPDGEITVTNSTGAYFKLDTDGVWRSGAWTHGVHSSLSVPGIAPRWIGSNGKLYEGGSDTYVSDGGTTGANGTAVTWYIETKRFMFGRFSLRNVFWGDSTESPTSGTPVYPSLLPTINGVNFAALTKRDSKRNKHIPVTYVGQSFKFRISGDKDTVVDRCDLRSTPMSAAEQL